MSLKKVSHNFFSSFLERENGVPKFYESISYADLDKEIYRDEKPYKDETSSPALLEVTYVPNYLKTTLKKDTNFKTVKHQLVKGYAIDLTHIEEVDSYVKLKFKKNAKNIRRSIKRLETSFPIKYHLYHGNITKEEYDRLFDSLLTMIKKRFKQRNETSKQLAQWNETLNATYGLIKQNRASIFVIYNANEPIEISVNYHRDKIFYSAISSFDIDYFKFGLGHVEIYKQLIWCFENDYHYFDMGWGDLEYKNRWCNKTYLFEQFLLYEKKSLIGKLVSSITNTKVRTKNYLISKNVHLHVKNLKKTVRRYLNASQEPISFSFHDLSNETILPKKAVNLQNTKNTFIRRMVYDFLYTNLEHVDDIKVYQNFNSDREYYILGKKVSKICKVDFKK
ncbi:GNAT family N-acetyltransferase [Flagellimonas sp. HMM57]|uniref:GNAT family N-acetyltransferase n=1 Tax=unclassified Flagellimonas TaxID=2644544 RepID=UPI0013D06C3D|nr:MULTISPECIES: GNAT family N-acetyltransferase [unclassified Flagellimonas]UII76132.1 GNAT family N-acetyltransferase [Flagellimonas sp. HMM57]